jgi:hypothetical protein
MSDMDFLFRCMRMKRQRKAKRQCGQRDYGETAGAAPSAMPFGPGVVRRVSFDADDVRDYELARRWAMIR